MGNHNLTHSVTYDGIEFKNGNSTTLEKMIKDYFRVKLNNNRTDVNEEYNENIRCKIKKHE